MKIIVYIHALSFLTYFLLQSLTFLGGADPTAVRDAVATVHEQSRDAEAQSPTSSRQIKSTAVCPGPEPTFRPCQSQPPTARPGQTQPQSGRGRSPAHCGGEAGDVHVCQHVDGSLPTAGDPRLDQGSAPALKRVYLGGVGTRENSCFDVNHVK